MAFTQEAVRTPVAIADLSIELFKADPTTPQTDGATFSVQIRMSDGSLVVRRGNLIPHLTQAQINQLITFMNTMRTKAEAEILP